MTVARERVRDVPKFVDSTVATLGLPPEAGRTPLCRQGLIQVVELLRSFGGARPLQTLEIGLGYGVSAAVTLATGLVDRHLVLAYDGNAERTELARKIASSQDRSGALEIRMGLSQDLLPGLVQSGAMFDLALVDGGHRFDDVFVDTYYVARLLRPGGYMVLDDTWMPSIRHVVAWLRTNMTGVWTALPDVPGVSVFRRTGGEDQREWNHFVPFAVPRLAQSIWSRLLPFALPPAFRFK
jgi:hypothetical protein